jgi:5-methylcytosine-specific restriction protein A
MRLEFSRKVRAAIIARAAGKCEACTAVLKHGEGEVDHILPCALGGKPEAANGWLLCRVCHGEKTANDIRSMRKADRQRDKASGAVRPAGKIHSAGFAKSPKPVKLPMRKRTFDIFGHPIDAPEPRPMFAERTE